RGPAIQGLGASVPIENPLLHVRDANRILGLVQQRSLFPDLFLGLLSAGDITRNADHVGDPAEIVPHHTPLRFDVADAAVLEQEAEFGPLADSRGDGFTEDAPNALAVFGVDLLEGIGPEKLFRIAQKGSVGGT